MQERFTIATNVTFRTARCYACGTWWAVEERILSHRCGCPVCAANRINSAEEARVELVKRLQAQKSATTRAKQRTK